MADGRIFRDMRGLRKDNTGYDLKQIFIGSEGTLGVITAAAIQAAPQPGVVNVACFQLDTFEAVQTVFRAARESLGEILSAYEFWDGPCENLLQGHHGKLFENSGAFYVLIETGGSDAAHDQEKLTRVLEKVMTESLVLDGILAQDQKQQEAIWSRREGIPEACSKIPGKQVHKFDLSFPADSYYTLLPLLRERVQNGQMKSLDSDTLETGTFTSTWQPLNLMKNQLKKSKKFLNSFSNGQQSQAEVSVPNTESDKPNGNIWGNLKVQ